MKRRNPLQHAMDEADPASVRNAAALMILVPR